MNTSQSHKKRKDNIFFSDVYRRVRLSQRDLALPGAIRCIALITSSSDITPPDRAFKGIRGRMQNANAQKVIFHIG